MSEKPAATKHGFSPSNIPIPPCTPPCTPPCGFHPQSQPLSDHLLLYILPYLPVTTLLQLRAVNRHWHSLISTRRPLCSACFTLPPTTPPIGGTLELHPVFKKLDYWGYDLHLPCTPLDGRAQICGRSVMGEVVGEGMACRPAVKEVGVWLCGGVHTVRREGGVRVKDLVEGFDAVVQERRYATEGQRRFVWDYKTYPFAGFRTIPQLSSVDESRLVVTPVFFDTAAIVAELREGVWTKGCAGVAFCFELPG